MRHPPRPLWLLLAAAALPLTPAASHAQTVYTWTGGTGASSLFGTGTNWDLGAAPGSSLPANAANNDIAAFGAAGTSTTIQFNFGTVGTPYYLGTLRLTATNTLARTFGSNSGTPGVLVLNGTGANNLILENLSTNAAALMTVAPQSGGGTGPLTVQLVAADSTVNAVGNVVVSANVGEGATASGLTKTGAGTLTLSGTNGYTGGTTINGGTLQFATTAAVPTVGSVAVNAGGTLGVNLGGTGEFTTAASGSGSLGGLLAGATFAAGSGFSANTANAAAAQTYAGLLAGPDAANPIGLSKFGAGTLTLTNADNNARLTGSQAGTLALQAGTYSLDGTATTGYYVGRASAVAQTSAALSPVLTLGVAGGSSATLSAGTQDLRVAFNDAGVVTTGANITAVVNVNNASSLTVNNLLLTFAYANIAPVYNATLNVTDTATVNVLGRFDVGMNTAFADRNANINATANITGGTVTVTGATTVNAILGSAASGPATLRVSGGVLTTSQVLVRSRRANAIATFEVSGAGVVEAAGGVLIDRTVSSTQNTRVTLLGGTLRTSSIATTGAGQAGIGGTTTDGTLSLNGGTVVALGDNPAFVSGFTTTLPTIGANGVTFDTNAFAVGIGNRLQGTGVLTKAGAGTLTLSGANVYTGGTTVTAGTLAAGVASGVGNGAFGNNSNVTLADAAGVTLDVAGFNTQIGSLTGGGTAGGTVTLGAATLTFGGTARPPAFAGVVAGSGGVTRSGTGTQVLSGANTYTGVTTVTGGVLQFARRAALYGGDPAAWTDTSIVATGGTFAVNVGGPGEFTAADFDTLKALGTPTGGFLSGSAVGVDTTNAPGGNFTPAGTIDNPNGGANALGLTKLGTNALTLSSANTYSGVTTVAAGTLFVGADAPASAAGPLGNAASAVLLGDAAGADAALLTAGGFTVGRAVAVQAGGPGTATLGGGAAGLTTFAGTITLGKAAVFSQAVGGQTTFGGLVTGAGGLTVGSAGNAGTVVLAGANDFAGGTTVAAGTLLANNPSGSATGTGAVAVQAGATLGGTGFITPAAANAVTVAAGGTVRGGSAASPTGTLTVGNAVVLTGSGANPAALLIDLNGNPTTPVGTGPTPASTPASLLALTGAAGNLNFVAAGGPVSLRLSNDAGLTIGTPFAVTVATVANGATNFQRNGAAVGAGYAPGSDFTLSSASFASFDAVSLNVFGNALVLTATPIPEPATALGLAAVGLGAVGFARRTVRRPGGATGA